MIEYRKSGQRTFYKIDGENVTKVFNREKLSSIQVCVNWVVKSDAEDPYDSKVITEAEFSSAYSEALERITKMKI